MTVPLVTYNVLSSGLCEPNWFPRCRPADLHPAQRLPRVQRKLQAEIDRTGGRAVIALHEVSINWTGSLDIWFAARGYRLVSTQYGNAKSHYMGVGLAVPLAHFAIEAITVECPATAQPWTTARPGAKSLGDQKESHCPSASRVTTEGRSSDWIWVGGQLAFGGLAARLLVQRGLAAAVAGLWCLGFLLLGYLAGLAVRRQHSRACAVPS